ncbi:helix-turn-helix transcriptional regulator [Novosphingobium resinovorum]
MPDRKKRDFERLTPRQRECLRMVYDRLVSKEIAEKLGISSNTVDTYLTEAIAILGARNRRHAAALFHEYEAGQTTPGNSNSNLRGSWNPLFSRHKRGGEHRSWDRSICFPSQQGKQRQ